MLEFDGHALDPAIVSAQPMKPVQNVDLPQAGSLTGPQESSQVGTVKMQQEVLTVIIWPVIHCAGSYLNQFKLIIRKENLTTHLPICSISPYFLPVQIPPFLLPPQALMSLSSEQSPVSCSLSSAFPLVSKPTHTGGINVNAAPFQSVQAVRFLGFSLIR